MTPEMGKFKIGTGDVSHTSQGPASWSGAEGAALILSGAWLLGATLFFVMMGADGKEGAVLSGMAVILPAAVIWAATASARRARLMRQEIERLHAKIDNFLQAQSAQPGGARAKGTDASVARKLDEIAAAHRRIEAALGVSASAREAAPPRLPVRQPAKPAKPAPPAQAEDRRVALPPDAPAGDQAQPLERADFIRALNFPENAGDKAGFAALRRALKERPTAQMIQAAQDVLTLLSQDGIYMDDLRPDTARPEIWRNFAGGTRGRAIAALGGIQDDSSLTIAGERMKNDPIFRDAAHHFLRRFDQMFSSFAETANDHDIEELSDTRTARAFMLLGRVAGTFD